MTMSAPISLATSIGMLFAVCVDVIAGSDRREDAPVVTSSIAMPVPGGRCGRRVPCLTSYTDQRILFYRSSDEQQLRRVNADTAQLQTELWATVARLAACGASPDTFAQEWSGIHRSHS
jgi:hypothetical protein